MINAAITGWGSRYVPSAGYHCTSIKCDVVAIKDDIPHPFMDEWI